MAIADPRTLSRPEIFALNWLSRRAVAAYEHCRGASTDRLIALGLAQKALDPIRANGGPRMVVSITRRGTDTLNQLCEDADRR